MVVVNGTNIEFSEVSTNDIGDTTPLAFRAIISSGSLVLTANVSSGTWSFKSMVKIL
jgi:hypothetical protein